MRFVGPEPSQILPPSINQIDNLGNQVNNQTTSNTPISPFVRSPRLTFMNPFMSGLGMFSGYGGMFGFPFGNMMGGYQRPSFGRPPMMSGFGGFGGYGSPFGGLGMFGMSPYGGYGGYGMFGGMINPFMNPFMNTQPTPNQLPADAVTTEYRPRVAAPFQQGPEAVDDGTLLSATSTPAMPVPRPGLPVNNRLPPLPNVVSPESKTILTDAPQLNEPYLR